VSVRGLFFVCRPWSDRREIGLKGGGLRDTNPSGAHQWRMRLFYLRRIALIGREARFFNALDLGNLALVDGDLDGAEAQVLYLLTRHFEPIRLRIICWQGFSGDRVHRNQELEKRVVKDRRGSRRQGPLCAWKIDLLC